MKCVSLLIVLALATPVPAAARGSGQKPSPPGTAVPAGQMRVYPTKYYIIHSDLDEDDVKEAVLRMTRMAEEYHERTRGFSGEIRERLPFFLFRTREEYYDAGGLPGSAGVFDGSRLMAIAGEETGGQTWHVVQHEGFHQFAHAVIRGELPAWLNEGIAEYFGESLFTGDSFVSGVIPPDRLARVKQEIRENRFKPIQGMMLTGQAEWNNRLKIENYDQAWSMVHFLAQGQDGRYQQAFVSFMQLIGRGVNWQLAWQRTFGSAAGFEQQWRDYWLNLPENPSRPLYGQAAVATLTSFAARAAAQKQHFDSLDEFFAAAKEGKVRTGESIDEWLPRKLLEHAVTSVEESHLECKLTAAPDGSPQVVLALPDGVLITGRCAIRAGRVLKVAVDVDDTVLVVKRADALLEAGKKSDARVLLQQALKARPNSPSAPQVREALDKARNTRK